MIVLAEEIVEPEVIRSDPDRTVIPGFLVTAVAHVPNGCRPSPCPDYYGRDHAFFAAYHERRARAKGSSSGSRAGSSGKRRFEHGATTLEMVIVHGRHGRQITFEIDVKRERHEERLAFVLRHVFELVRPRKLIHP